MGDRMRRSEIAVNHVFRVRQHAVFVHVEHAAGPAVRSQHRRHQHQGDEHAPEEASERRLVQGDGEEAGDKERQRHRWQQAPEPLAAAWQLQDERQEAAPEQASYSVLIDINMVSKIPVANGLASVQIQTKSMTILERWSEMLRRGWQAMKQTQV